MSPVRKALSAFSVLSLVVAALSWAAARGLLHRTPKPPPGIENLLIAGCRPVEASADERYPVGLRLCLHSDHVTFRAADHTVYDGWKVIWSRDGADWRMTVPPDQSEGADVHFAIGPADGGLLAFRSSRWLGGRDPR